MKTIKLVAVFLMASLLSLTSCIFTYLNIDPDAPSVPVNVSSESEYNSYSSRGYVNTELENYGKQNFFISTMNLTKDLDFAGKFVLPKAVPNVNMNGKTINAIGLFGYMSRSTISNGKLNITGDVTFDSNCVNTFSSMNITLDDDARVLCKNTSLFSDKTPSFITLNNTSILHKNSEKQVEFELLEGEMLTLTVTNPQNYPLPKIVIKSSDVYFNYVPQIYIQDLHVQVLSNNARILRNDNIIIDNPNDYEITWLDEEPDFYA